MFPLVSITLFLPLVGATLLVLMRGSPPRLAHAVGIVASGLTLLGSLLVWARGTAGEGVSQVAEAARMPALNAAPRARIPPSGGTRYGGGGVLAGRGGSMDAVLERRLPGRR